MCHEFSRPAVQVFLVGIQFVDNVGGIHGNLLKDDGGRSAILDVLLEFVIYSGLVLCKLDRDDVVSQASFLNDADCCGFPS